MGVEWFKLSPDRMVVIMPALLNENSANFVVFESAYKVWGTV